MNEFLSRLREKMKAEQDTQMALSRKSGVPQPTISRLLNGKNVGTRHTLAMLEYLEPLSATISEEETTDEHE